MKAEAIFERMEYKGFLVTFWYCDALKVFTYTINKVARDENGDATLSFTGNYSKYIKEDLMDMLKEIASKTIDEWDCYGYSLFR